MNSIKTYLVNDAICNKSVHIVGEDGLGPLISKEVALRVADEEGLDLVEVSVEGNVSICKLMNYSKYLFEQKKKEKSNQSKKEVTKEIKFGATIAEHDLKIKAKSALINLENGCKIKVIVMFKGREVNRIEDGKLLLEKFYSVLPENIIISKPPTREGNNYTMELNIGK